MKILFLAPQPFYVGRGTPIAVRAALEGLSALGHEIDLLTYHEGEEIVIPRVRTHRIARPPLVRRVPIGPSWQKLVCDASLFRAASRMVRRGEYDLIHAVEEAAFIAAHLGRRAGVPFVYDMDSLMSEQIADKGAAFRPAAAVFGRLERHAVRRSVGVLAVCPALVEFARRHHPDGRVALLPDVPLNAAAEGVAPDGVAGAPGVKLVYVGNLEAYQGIDLMLEAFGLMAAECPEATLVIVGGREDHVEHYRRVAGPLAASGRVRLTGPCPIERLGSVLAAADILVSPRTLGRNTPMKVYSYLESGRPVIATRLPTHTQVMTEDSALLVEPTPRAMAEGMRELVRSPERRAALGRRGREHVRREFSAERFGERLRAFYDEVERCIRPPRRGGELAEALQPA